MEQSTVVKMMECEGIVWIWILHLLRKWREIT